MVTPAPPSLRDTSPNSNELQLEFGEVAESGWGWEHLQPNHRPSGEIIVVFEKEKKT